MNGGGGIATSHLDSMLLSSVRELSQRGEDQPYPSYMDNDKYIQFMQQVLKTKVQENQSGYLSILLDKEVYTAGEVIRGSVFIDLFNPSVSKDIFIQFKGTTKITRKMAQMIDESIQNKPLAFERGFDLRPKKETADIPAEDQEIMIGFDDNYSRRQSLGKKSVRSRLNESNNGSPEKMNRVGSARSITGFVMSGTPRSKNGAKSQNLIPVVTKSNSAVQIMAQIKMLGKDKNNPSRVNSFNESSTTQQTHDLVNGQLMFPQIGHAKNRKNTQGVLITNKLVSKQDKIIQEIQSMGYLGLEDGHSKNNQITEVPSHHSLSESKNLSKAYKSASSNEFSMGLIKPPMLSGSIKSELPQLDQTINPNNIEIQTQYTKQQLQNDQINVQNIEEGVDQSISAVQEDDEEVGNYLLFKLDERLYKFRGDKMPQGQYEFNFTFQIPQTSPSTFKYISAVGEHFSVQYHIHVYFNDPSPLMINTREVKILGMQMRKKSSAAKSTRTYLSDLKVETRLSIDKSNEKLQPPTAINNISSQESGTLGVQQSIQQTNSIKKSYNENPYQIHEEQKTKINPAEGQKNYFTNSNKEDSTGQNSDEDSQSTRSSISVNKYSCFVCPGVVPIEARMLRQVYRPDEQVEIKLQLNKIHSQVISVRTSLVMDLSFYNVITGDLVNTIEQELGFESLSKDELARRITHNTSSVVVTLNLQRIRHRNEQIWNQFMVEMPECGGVLINENMVSNQLNYLSEKDQKLMQKAKRISKSGAKKIPNPKDINFQHRDEFGLLWEQSYQYVQFASSLGEIMKAKFNIILQIKIGNMIQTQIRDLKIPIEILAPYQINQQQRKLKYEIEQCKSKILAQRNAYPKPRLPPQEFNPITLPGAHYKLEELEDEGFTGHFKRKTHYDNVTGPLLQNKKPLQKESKQTKSGGLQTVL